MKEIGAYLKETRMGHGVTIEEASEDLNMPKGQLENIESGNTRAFKDVYQLKEYVREYAKYLGLDANKMLDEFNDFLFEKTSKISLEDIKNAANASNKEEEKAKVVSPYTVIPTRKKNYFPYLLGAIIVLLVILIFYLLLQGSRREEPRTNELKGIYTREEVI